MKVFTGVPRKRIIRDALLACTWSTKDIANETNIPERDIVIYFEDIPWFENNFFNKVIIEEEV